MADQETPASPTPPLAAGDKSVQLGIGTLIIIALIVTMCSGKGEMEKIRKDTADLKQQVGDLNRKLDTLIEKESGSAANPAAPAPPPDSTAKPAGQ